MQKIETSYLSARIEEFGIQEPVLELGAGWQPEFHQRPFRARGVSRFLTQEAQLYAGAPVPDYHGDLCKGADIPDEIAGTALLFNVLEHIPEPWVAIREVWRVLRVDGLLIGSVPFRTAIHRWPGDYFAVKPDGLAILLRQFKMVHFAIDGDAALPANLLFAAIKDVNEADWIDHNVKIVLSPEIIVGNDYLTGKRLKRAIVNLLRRFGYTLELYVTPRHEGRMKELGYREWTVRSYTETEISRQRRDRAL
jgi:SAM-dependent methyltransferase